MKLTKILVIALFCAMSLNAQEIGENVQDVNEKSERSHELGLNMTVFTEFLLDRTSNPDLVSPYLITYKLLSESETSAVRFGLGGNVSTSSDPTENRKSNDSELNFRVGLEKRMMLTKKWMVFYGADLLMGFNTVGSKTNNVTTKNNIYSIGCGPILGIQVMFNERIGLNTEMKLYYEHKEFEDKFLSNTNSNNDITERSRIDEVNIFMPLSLYLIVKL